MAVLLVVDDDQSVLALCRALFEARGHEVVLADDAPSALRILGSRSVDAVVSDLQMPGMDGLELRVAVRESHPLLPLVVWSAGWRDVDRGVPPVAIDKDPATLDIDALLAVV